MSQAATENTGETGAGTAATGTGTTTGNTTTGATATTTTTTTTDTGFPADTPVAEMSTPQQAAYWKHQAKRHETRNSAWMNVLGGKTPEEIAAERQELVTLRTERLSESERAIEAAKAEGRKEAAPTTARAVFEMALSHVEDDAKKAKILGLVDISSVIKEDGTIDTAKVKEAVDLFAPASSEGGKPHTRDFGAGERQANQAAGVAAGRQLFAERHKKKTTTD